MQRMYFVKACGDGDVEGIQLRLDRGEDVESTDLQGNTGMHVAAAVSNVAVMQLLLDNLADKEARNRNVRGQARERARVRATLDPFNSSALPLWGVSCLKFDWEWLC